MTDDVWADVPQLAVSPSDTPWAAALVAFTRNHGTARCRYTVIEERQLLLEPVDVFVTDASFSRLDVHLVEELHRVGTRVVAVTDPGGEHRRALLEDWGVDAILSDTDPVESILGAVVSLCNPDEGPSSSHRPVGVDPPPPSRDADAPGQHRANAAEMQARGIVVAVGSPSGGCGATEVSIALARAAKGVGRVALLDADDVESSLAQRLGLGDEVPNMRHALLSFAHGRLAFETSLTPWCDTGIDALPGLPGPSDWRHLRAGDPGRILDALAARYPIVVANVGHRLERLEFDDGRSRHLLTREVVAAADIVLGVATPYGIGRALDWFEQVRRRTRERTPVHVLVNSVTGADRSFYESEITEEFLRSATPAGLWFAPFDPKVRKATWDGTEVGAGPFSSAIATVAETILPDVQPARRWRLGRLRSRRAS